MSAKRRRRIRLRGVLAVLVLAALVVCTIPVAGFTTRATSSFTEYEQGLLAAGFPESYVHLLSRLHEQHPAWKFEPYHTGLNWTEAVAAECSGGRSLIVHTADEVFKSKAAGCYDPATGAYTFVESGFVTASEFAVSFYMDPRNFLREEYILQFESLAYNEGANELAVIEKILAGSVLSGQILYKNSKGELLSIDTTYAQAIQDAGRRHGVNPYYLASKLRNEVGSGGATISGTVAGYEGLYNFYNIYAYGASSIQQSLAWAGSGTTYNRPWTTPVRSIDGGAEYIASGYLARGQNTSYFQRFNVVSKPYYSHQYMTALHGAAEEALNSYKAISAEVLNAERTFVIPVYNNMPQSSAYLADSISLVNYAGSGVANASVNLRTSPTTSVSNRSGIVLPEGTAVTILEEVRSSGTDFLKYPYWYKVAYTGASGSHEGYVRAKYISASYTQNPLELGSTLQLQYLLSPSGASEAPVVFSSDSAVAAVNSGGTVVGAGEGVAYITARTNNGSRVTMCLSVMPSVSGIVSVTELVLNAEQLTLSSGETFRLAAQVFPQDATLKTIHWSSDNPSVAAVGADGTVQAVSGGTAVIVASAADGGVFASCQVTVNAPVIEEPKLEPTNWVDLDSDLSDLQQTIDELRKAIEEAEKLDALTAGLLESAPIEPPADMPEYDPDAMLPGLESGDAARPSLPGAKVTSFAVTVADENGAPVPDAAVVLKSASGKTVSTARHVTEGQYIFETILDGSYTVEITAPDGRTAAGAVALKNGAVDGETAFALQPPPQRSDLGVKIAIGAGGLILLVIVISSIVSAVRRKKAGRKQTWYRQV